MTKKKYKYGKKYNRNLITGKIHRLLDKNPQAGYAELEKMFGKVTRSIIVTYYSVYKDMFNKSGHLRKPKQYKTAPNTIRSKVVAYFAEHPNNTTKEAANALNMSWNQIHNALYTLKIAGRIIPYRRLTGIDKERGKALQIRNYFKMNPNASVQECAKDLEISSQYVSFIAYKARQTGKLPKNEII